jgi:hypothetical protein
MTTTAAAAHGKSATAATASAETAAVTAAATTAAAMSAFRIGGNGQRDHRRCRQRGDGEGCFLDHRYSPPDCAPQLKLNANDGFLCREKMAQSVWR